MEECNRCGNIIMEINIGTSKNPIFVKNCVKGDNNDLFCSYCASTCFFINGNMYDSFEEVRELKQKLGDK